MHKVTHQDTTAHHNIQSHSRRQHSRAGYRWRRRGYNKLHTLIFAHNWWGEAAVTKWHHSRPLQPLAALQLWLPPVGTPVPYRNNMPCIQHVFPAANEAQHAHLLACLRHKFADTMVTVTLQGSVLGADNSCRLSSAVPRGASQWHVSNWHLWLPGDISLHVPVHCHQDLWTPQTRQPCKP